MNIKTVKAQTIEIKRPKPVENHDTAFFWQGVREHKLLIQRCVSCGNLRHPPGPMCPHCRSVQWDTVESAGKGKVYSYAVIHYPPIPPFEYPNPVGIIALEEGTRLVSQLVDVKPENIHMDMAVEVVFRDVGLGLTLPLFRPTGSEY